MVNTAEYEFNDIEEFKLRRSEATTLFVASVFVTIFAIVAVYAVFSLAKTHGIFTLSSLHIEGGETVDQQTIRRLLNVVEGDYLLTYDIVEAGKRIENHPWIKSVEIRKTLPAGLTVSVVERSPKAILSLSRIGLYYMVDEEGIVLGSQEKTKMSLPLISGIKIEEKILVLGDSVLSQDLKDTLRAMTQIENYRLFGKWPISAIDASNANHLKISFTGTDVSLLTPRFAWTDEMARLQTVDYLLNGKETSVQSINLRNNDKVNVSYPSDFEEKRGT